MELKIKNIALALAIIVLLNLFVYTGIRTFYKEPDRALFCGDIYSRGPIYTEEECIAAGGQWYPYPQPVQGELGKPAPTGSCNEKAVCQKLYEETIKPYDRNVFIIYVILGLLSLFIGFLIKADAVSAGLNFGAVILFFTGTARFWREMDDYLRFIVVTIALVIVIWLGYKKLKS